MSNTSSEQESLFAISQETGRIVERDVYAENEIPTISIVERAIHLDNVLELFNFVNQRRRFVDDVSKSRPEVVQRRYGKSADQVVAGAELNAVKYMEAAKLTFARGFGYLAVQAGGDIDQDKLDLGLDREFEKFWFRYGPPSKQLERKAKREQLQAIIKAQHEKICQDHRDAGIRPHAELVTEKDQSHLGTQARLQAICGDVRAGFLPRTHHEKNMVLAFLDYQDNDEYELGIRDQFLEVVYSQRKKFGHYLGVQLGEESAISRTYEIEDMLRNALQQLALLRGLEARIHDCPNPHVSLADEVGLDHPGIPALVQYIDLTELRETGRVAGLKRDPLRTHRNEAIVEPGLAAKKNKVLENPYQRSELRPEFAKRIETKAKELRIGPMRRAVSEAIADQERRAYYMTARLIELVRPTNNAELKLARGIAFVALRRAVELRAHAAA